VGLFEKLARDHFLSEKEPKIKFFDFGAIQKIMKMLSREKIIFQMLFGASHGTPHNVCRIIFEIDLSTIAYHFQDPNVQYLKQRHTVSDEAEVTLSPRFQIHTEYTIRKFLKRKPLNQTLSQTKSTTLTYDDLNSALLRH